MIQARCGLGLPPETGDLVFAQRCEAREELERDLTVEPHVFRKVDGSLAATADLAD
jgi:hypothetical protein